MKRMNRNYTCVYVFDVQFADVEVFNFNA